jgi:BRCT domain type II-containing protein
MQSRALSGVVATPVAKTASIEDAKIAQAARVLEQQSRLIEELHQAYQNEAKRAAALTQAAKLAADGVIDVRDVIETSQKLQRDGQVKISAPGEAPAKSLGTVAATYRILPSLAKSSSDSVNSLAYFNAEQEKI